MRKPANKKPAPRRQKSNEDIRNEGIVLMKNSIKVHTLCEPLLMSYFRGSSESSDVNWACYFLQQTIELSLKGIIKYYYEDFISGHLVSPNAEILEELSATIIELREISDLLIELRGKYSVTIMRWESISRYKNLYVEKYKVEHVASLADELLAFVRRHEYCN